MKPKIKLVTRADDAGSCRSANEAILEAVEAGTIKNVGFMAVGPEIEHAVELLGGRDDICYGLHLTLNSEWEEVKWGPLTNVPALIDKDGHFLPFPQNTKKQIERILKQNEMDADRLGLSAEPDDVWGAISSELNAQMKRLRELGLSPSYVDNHMGVSGIDERIRHDIELLCRADELINPHPLSSLPKIESSGDEFADLRKRILAASLDAYVWVTHPGKFAPDMNRFYLRGGKPGVVARERDAERQFLIDPRLPQMWAELKVKPCRYDEVLKPPSK